MRPELLGSLDQGRSPPRPLRGRFCVAVLENMRMCLAARKSTRVNWVIIVYAGCFPLVISGEDKSKRTYYRLIDPSGATPSCMGMTAAFDEHFSQLHLGIHACNGVRGGVRGLAAW